MISSRRQKNVDDAVNELHAELGIGRDVLDGVVCNIGDPDHRSHVVQQTLEQFGGQINILIQNAAVNPHVGNILEVELLHVGNQTCKNLKRDAEFPIYVQAQQPEDRLESVRLFPFYSIQNLHL